MDYKYLAPDFPGFLFVEKLKEAYKKNKIAEFVGCSHEFTNVANKIVGPELSGYKSGSPRDLTFSWQGEFADEVRLDIYTGDVTVLTHEEKSTNIAIPLRWDEKGEKIRAAVLDYFKKHRQEHIKSYREKTHDFILLQKEVDFNQYPIDYLEAKTAISFLLNQHQDFIEQDIWQLYSESNLEYQQFAYTVYKIFVKDFGERQYSQRVIDLAKILAPWHVDTLEDAYGLHFNDCERLYLDHADYFKGGPTKPTPINELVL